MHTTKPLTPPATGGVFHSPPLAVALAATFSGCYVGKATFQGEDMRMYPFFSTTAATTAPTD